MCFFLVAAPEIGMTDRVRLSKPARAVEEARRHDEYSAATNYPDANRSDVFVLRPYNVANEPRATVTGSHKRVRRDGSICVLDGPIK